MNGYSKNLIVLSGADGTGKSTLVTEVRAILLSEGSVRVTWRRFGLVFSRLLNFYGRLIGKSYYQNSPLGRIGYHSYRGYLAKLYVLSVLLDFMLFVSPKWRVLDFFSVSKFNIVDRFLIDIVADVILSTSEDRLVLRLFSRVVRMHLRRVNCFVLSCGRESVMIRRPDIQYDEAHDRKRLIYKKLRRLFNIATVHTDKLSPNECAKWILIRCR